MSITTVLKQVVLFGIALGLVIFCTMVLFGQDKKEYKYKNTREFCSDNSWSNGEKVSLGKSVR